MLQASQTLLVTPSLTLGGERRISRRRGQKAREQPRARDPGISEVQSIFSEGRGSSRVGLQAPVTDALPIGRGVLVHERPLPDRFEIRREAELVHVPLIEAAQLAANLRLHLVFDLRA